MAQKVKKLTPFLFSIGIILALSRLYRASVIRQSSGNGSRILYSPLYLDWRIAAYKKHHRSDTVKRVFDIIASAVGIIMILPVLVVIAVVIWLTSPGGILYRAQRVGRNGQVFHLYKFRSMVTDADQIGPGITTAGDPRITPIGYLLRATKFDELPQLFNVLFGHMSLVGPRPEDPRYIRFYTDKQRDLLTLRPGVTSPASIRMRNESEMLTGDDWETVYINEVLPEKLAIDQAYFEDADFWSDLGVIFDTFRCILKT